MFSILFVSNIHVDMYGALAVVPAIFGFMSHILTYSHLMVSRERFYLLADELRDIVNESTYLRLVSAFECVDLHRNDASTQ